MKPPFLEKIFKIVLIINFFAAALALWFVLYWILFPVEVTKVSTKWDFITASLSSDIQSQILVNQVEERIGQEKGDYMVYIKDLTNSVEWKIGNECRYPPASTFKVYTATLTLLSIERGDLYWGSKVKLTKGLVSPGPGTYFTEEHYNKYYSVSDLLYRMIVLSDNTAQSMLFALLGKSNIETRLSSDLGLENTSLLEFYTTNTDMASVLERHYNKKILSEKNSDYFLDLLYQTIARDRIRAGIPIGTRASNKGGTLDTSKHDVAIVYGPQVDYILAVYTEHVKNDKAIITIKDVSKIVWDILEQEDVLGAIPDVIPMPVLNEIEEKTGI